MRVKDFVGYDYRLDKSIETKSFRYPDDLIERILNGEFYAVRNELVNIFESRGLLIRDAPVKTTQPTSSNSVNNLDSNETSTSSSSVESDFESYYINESLETIEICSKELSVTDSDSDGLIIVVD